MDRDSRAGAHLQDPFLSLAAPRPAPLGCGAFAGGGGLGVRGQTEALVPAPCSGPMHLLQACYPHLPLLGASRAPGGPVCSRGAHSPRFLPAHTEAPQAPEPEVEGVGSRPPDPAAFTRGRGAGSSVLELKSLWDVM
uniref:Uncharacterized protein n=1 Tax=Myotis myotis TaxID=51298 RepID=A0A7J7R1Q6_MYOMY|nr:hypothetical protein mMyoMyo1_011218 [Myotis myotis]